MQKPGNQMRQEIAGEHMRCPQGQVSRFQFAVVFQISLHVPFRGKDPLDIFHHHLPCIRELYGRSAAVKDLNPDLIFISFDGKA